MIPPTTEFVPPQSASKTNSVLSPGQVSDPTHVSQPRNRLPQNPEQILPHRAANTHPPRHPTNMEPPNPCGATNKCGATHKCGATTTHVETAASAVPPKRSEAEPASAPADHTIHTIHGSAPPTTPFLHFLCTRCAQSSPPTLLNSLPTFPNPPTAPLHAP